LGARLHPSAGSPRWPQRHGFIAAISWTRAGKVTWALARATVTSPVSSGWRSESSAALEFGQFVEEQHAQMRQADLAGPHAQAPAGQRGHRGRMVRAAKGRARLICPSSSIPATEATSEASSASLGVRSGRMPGRHEAISDLPAPGGPTSRRLCPPAAAISSARLAVSCP
jgi:hypothetical protein